MTTITWINDDGKTCVLTIEDERNTTTALTPAAEPFTTSIQESDDLFTPIRTGNGYIRVVVDSVDDIAYLVGAAPLHRAVYLTVGSTQRWKGFLACESFTQSWDKGPIEIELPVISPLEAAKGFYPSAALADLGYINIAQFLYNLSTSIGASFTSGSAWSRFYFPVLSETPATLKYYFDRKNYATAIDKNTKHEVASYYEILEDICKLFGWQAIEYEYELVFMAADVKKYESVGSHNAAYKGYNLSRMLQIATGGSSDVNDRPYFEAVIPTIFGADHDMTWIAGKKSVEVTGQLNERDEVIWSMDVVSQCVYKGSDNYNAGGTYQYHYYIKKYASYKSEGETTPNGNILVYNTFNNVSIPNETGDNVKFYNMEWDTDTEYGGTIAYEQQYMTENDIVTAGSDNWATRLILKATSSDMVAFRLRTNFFWSPTQNAQTGNLYDCIRIEGTLLYAANARDYFVKPSGDHYTKASLKVEGVSQTYYWSPSDAAWITTYTDFLIHSKDGKFINFGYYHNGILTFYEQILLPDVEGNIQLNLIAAASTSVHSWPGTTAYIAYEDLKIKIVAASNVRGYVNIEDKEQRMNENQKKINLNNGFTDEWSQDCGLTLAREAVPDSYGVVLDANKAQPAEGNLYDNKTPEDALAARASNYYQKARLRIRAIVESKNKMLSPLVPYTFTQGGKPFIVMEQQHNWRTNEVRANFYEPSYETL